MTMSFATPGPHPDYDATQLRVEKIFPISHRELLSRDPQTYFYVRVSRSLNMWEQAVIAQIGGVSEEDYRTLRVGPFNRPESLAEKVRTLMEELELQSLALKHQGDQEIEAMEEVAEAAIKMLDKRYLVDAPPTD